MRLRMLRTEGTLTLSPFSPAVRDLTLDELEDIQLQHRVRHFRNSLQHRLSLYHEYQV